MHAARLQNRNDNKTNRPEKVLDCVKDVNDRSVKTTGTRTLDGRHQKIFIQNIFPPKTFPCLIGPSSKKVRLNFQILLCTQEKRSGKINSAVAITNNKHLYTDPRVDYFFTIRPMMDVSNNKEATYNCFELYDGARSVENVHGDVNLLKLAGR